MAFYTILTEVGKAKLANATALGATVELTTIAVGDGNGAEVTPQESMTALVNQIWSGPINHLYVDSNNSNWIVAEGYIPTDVGDFTIREVGLFDADGDLIAIGNYPETYKPINTSGSAKDLYLKVIIEVSNSYSVELKIDPAIVLASRSYVDDSLAAHNTDITAHENLAQKDLSNVEDGDILAKLKKVDGAGSGLDADLLRGLPADFSSSLASAGYQKLPSGLIIQWGIANSPDDNVNIVTFPIAFPNACIYVGVGGHVENTENAGPVMTWEYTTTSFKLDRGDSNYDGEWNFFYVAIGY